MARVAVTFALHRAGLDHSGGTAMSWSTLIMYAVAAVFAGLGLLVVTRRAASAAAVYRRRIGGTMLLALSLILAVFATVFHDAGGVA